MGLGMDVRGDGLAGDRHNRPLQRMGYVSALALLTSLLLSTAAGAGTSSSGTWSHQRCTFTGQHFNQDGDALAVTTRSDSNCQELGVRLRYCKYGSGTSNWVYNTGDIGVRAREASALASRHVGKDLFSGSWSSVKEPHAFWLYCV